MQTLPGATSRPLSSRVKQGIVYACLAVFFVFLALLYQYLQKPEQTKDQVNIVQGPDYKPAPPQENHPKKRSRKSPNQQSELVTTDPGENIESQESKPQEPKQEEQAKQEQPPPMKWTDVQIGSSSTVRMPSDAMYTAGLMVGVAKIRMNDSFTAITFKADATSIPQGVDEYLVVYQGGPDPAAFFIDSEGHRHPLVDPMTKYFPGEQANYAENGQAQIAQGERFFFTYIYDKPLTPDVKSLDIHLGQALDLRVNPVHVKIQSVPQVTQ